MIYDRDDEMEALQRDCAALEEDNARLSRHNDWLAKTKEAGLRTGLPREAFMVKDIQRDSAFPDTRDEVATLKADLMMAEAMIARLESENLEIRQHRAKIASHWRELRRMLEE